MCVCVCVCVCECVCVCTCIHTYTNQFGACQIETQMKVAVQAALAAGIRRMEVRIDPVPNLEEVDLGFFFWTKFVSQLQEANFFFWRSFRSLLE